MLVRHQPQTHIETMKYLAALSLILIAVSPAATLAEDPVIKDVTLTEADKLLAEKDDLIVLDIRTPKEYANGHLKDAMMIDFLEKDFKTKLAELDRTKPYLVHCASGGRSRRSLKNFRDLGFQKVYHLSAGYSGWASSGRDTVK